MAHDPYQYFRVEARELLDQLIQGVLDFEKGSATPELMQRLLRFAHTLKGAARVVKHKEIADRSHALEDKLSVLRDGAPVRAREEVSGVLEILDAIGERVSALSAPANTSDKAEHRLPPDEPFRAPRTDVEELAALIDGVAAAHVQVAALRRGLGNDHRLRQLHKLLVDQLRLPHAQRHPHGSSAKILTLVEELGELLTTLERHTGAGLEHVERELRQVRETAETLRLSPAGLMFNALERTARDAAQSLGRSVSFEASGGHVRLDPHVLGIVQNALVQIVRNAIAHGIEPESARVAAGKPPLGKVSLDVVRRSNRVSFLCRDDGRGVEFEAVRRAAQRKGTLSVERENLDTEELVRLLLKGGITTSQTVTEVSGRGIGLDVVREAASHLGGEVKVRSEVGRGATFEIVVPVSLTSLDALLVEAGSQTAIIPLDAVRRTLRVRASDVAHTTDGDSIVLEGMVVPFAPLAQTLRVAPGAASTKRSWSAVVIESAGALAAVGVDRLLGTQNVVLRPLPWLSPANAVIAGASTDAEGDPQLVIDAEALVAAVRQVPPATQRTPTQPLPILIIDDSLTTRMLEQSILESAGYEVELAVSGEDGLQKTRERQYALLLVDVEMPGIDGFEFIEQIRADPALRDVPVILVSSRASLEDKQRGQDVGAQEYVVKSDFNQTNLLAQIHKLVG